MSPRARRYVIEIYLAAGAPEQALAVVRAADLGAASYVERFKAAEGTARPSSSTISRCLRTRRKPHRELAGAARARAATDTRVKPTAEYYLRRP